MNVWMNVWYGWLDNILLENKIANWNRTDLVIIILVVKTGH